jgi:glycosyltransferase involved in cell wall biosynthesis
MEKGLKDDTMELFLANFYKWQISHRLFMDYTSKGLYIERSNLHRTLTAKMKQFLEFDFPVIEKANRNPDRVLVTISQFLGIKHGPTRNALDYCYTLQKKLNKEVFLFVASEMPVNLIPEYENPGINYSYFNHVSEYDNFFALEYLNEKIQGFQCKINGGNKDKIKEFLKIIYDWKPAVIYNIGSENLVVDLLGTITAEASVPLGNTLPITMGGNLIMTRRPEERDKEAFAYLAGKHQNVIESFFVYKLEEPIKRYKKIDFNIPEDAYVIAIVGTRLAQEIVGEFIGILQQILELDPKIHIVFFGNFTDFEDKHAEIGYGDRVLYLGHQSDLRGALNIAELYLNPIRKGGGTSSAEALAEGVPVITLGNCDVSYTSGDDFIIESTEQMPVMVQKYMTDKDFYQSQREKAFSQADRLVDTEAVLREILGKIEEVKA